MLTIENLANIMKKVKEVTGIDAYFNSKSQTSSNLKFDMRYKGLGWKTPLRQGIARFDLVLCASGNTEQFVLDMIHAEITISETMELTDCSEKMLHKIQGNEAIELIWIADESDIEEQKTDNGVDYYYKRFFKLNYHFLNS